MKKRFLPVLLVVLQLLALSPIWSATAADPATKKKKPVTAAATDKKPAVKPAGTTTGNKPAVKPAGAASNKKPAQNTVQKPATKTVAAKSSISKENLQHVTGHLGLLNEVWLRKITLEYLADKRSDEYLSKLLADFPKRLQRNFLSNIRGDFKPEILANYAAKSEDVTDNLFALFKDEVGYDRILGNVLKKSEFPLDLAYFDLVKKVSARRKFQASNKEADQKVADYWQTVYGKMRENAKKDRYDAVAALYKDMPIKEFPIRWFDDAQYAIAFETEGSQPAAPSPQGRKKWTFLVYSGSDNDLEHFGLKDLNEMEMVGSSNDVNIVVQIDRQKEGLKGATIADGNWTGTRRYYVTKDSDMNKIGSQMVMNLGEKHMADKNTLADFLKWGVSTYPADNVAVVIWTHGGGWIGIAPENDHKLMSLPGIAWALREGQKELSRVNGKASKFAIVDFDACLMGTIEVAYELSDSVEFLVASQENEPGDGMPYADYLAPLVKNPSLSPREFTKRMVGTYVYSYSKGGSANVRAEVTKSAVDLSKLPGLVKKFDALAKAFLANHQLYAEALVDDGGKFASIRRYSDDTLVDLVDFAHKMAQSESLPPEVRKICIDIIKTVGYPVEKDRLAQPVIITSKEPGVVVWGYNDWRMPPKSIWPSGTKVFNSRLALTPLKEMKGGGYSVKIGPFEPVVDEALEKRVFVDEINYQIITKDGKSLDKRRVRQGKEHLIVSKFPEHSPMVIEGHTQGMGDSRGLSIYFPSSYKFRNTYKSLKFAKDTGWDEFLEKIPVFKRTADVLLCGPMVDDPMTFPLIARALSANNVKFQVLWDPSVFAYDFKSILSKFAGNGLVIVDGVSASSMGQLSPSSDDLIDYLNRGGKLMVAAQSFGKSNIHRKLLKDYFRFTFVDEEKDFDDLVFKGDKDEFTMTLNGSESSRTAEDITIMKAAAPAKIFVNTSDGRGAGIYVSDKSSSGKSYAGVYLGFRFEAIGDTAARNRFMGEILDRLLPQRHQLSLF